MGEAAGRVWLEDLQPATTRGRPSWSRQAREAIFLVTGDKAGNWERWYREAIPLADARVTEHLIALKEEQGR